MGKEQSMGLIYGSTIEVNGNRFDNPELLENER